MIDLTDLGYDLTEQTGWLKFEAMLLGPGLFERLPFTNAEFTPADASMVRMWRKVLSLALFDILRGPNSTSVDPNEIANRKVAYKDTVHWLMKTKPTEDYELDKKNADNALTDFEQVCMLADLDKNMVKGVFARMLKERAKIFGSIEPQRTT